MVRVKLVGPMACLLFAATMAGAAPARPKKRPPDAPAQAPTPEAQQRFQRALDLYEEGNLDAARAELQRAYDIAPHFRLLYNLGQIAFELHDYPAALAAFEKYLSEGGAKVPEARRSQVESDVEKLKGRVARIAIRVDLAQADVFVDDVAIGTTPLSGPLVVSAGRRKIAVAKDGYATITRWVELAGGDSSEVAIDLDQAPERTAAPTASSPAGMPWVERDSDSSTPANASRGGGVLWGGWVAAGSLAVAAAVTGGLAYATSQDLRDRRNRLGVTREELDQKAVEVRNLSLATDVAVGASVVTAVITLVATVSRTAPSSAGTGSVRIVPSLGRVDVSGSF